ncbi:hypothetical protein JCM3770_007064 [Rhodotorula araucariae]
MPRPRKAQPASQPAPPVTSSGLALTLAHAQLPLAPIPQPQPQPPQAMRAKPNKETTKNVPAFLTKLFTMVSDPDTDDLIRWSDDGDSFFVPSADRMGKELLPHYFKHQNFGSFVRQLNMYGFHKVPHLQQGVLKRDNADEGDMLEFSNPNFQRGQPDLLCMIHRKVKGEGAVIPSADGTFDISSLLTDLAAIRKHQTAISADLKDLQARNHALWQEAVQSREKHKKQEETINRILRFLAGVFGGQVVDQGGAAPTPQVQGDTASPAVQAPGVGAQGGSGNGVVLMPKGRLLLEDVKGRQSAALRELDGSDEEIEEIPLLRGDDDGLPTISSSLVASAPTASMGTLTRAPSASSGISNRFTAIPSPANSSALPTPTDGFGIGIDPAQYGFTAETLGALAGSADPSSAFNAFFSQPPAGAASTSLAPSPAQTSTALMPFTPTPTSNPLENPFALTPTAGSSAPPPPLAAASAAPGAMSPSFASALAENNSAVANLLSEKADIDSRTAALEAQIARLMENLPDDAREQVENAQLPAVLPDLPTPGTDAHGSDWSGFAMDDGGIDFDKMLAQFSEIVRTANPAASDFLPSTSHSDFSSSMPSYANGVTDYSDILSTAGHGSLPAMSTSAASDLPLDPALFAPPVAAPAAPYEVTSPSSSAGAGATPAAGSPASTAESAPTPASTTSEARIASTAARKRKSDVLGTAGSSEAASPAESEGTRRSQRKRRA